ncbi:hypothetical protein MJ717_001900 [Cronobacter sakazakii]|uniref:hypothetical protein n=1 Tax=Enterobacteriaceae TaxID=543 RepID=UPI00073565A6|nr:MULTISPECIES: hypothetical protein [Enterobacter cloacae complex]EGT0646151.1 hypothetical protein [Citrobacter braakii]EIX1503819.1 hypothetical protein [Cronobacter sakazakii]EHE7812054.1 hypothetical protein [Enterobacter hormaechei]EIX1526319.1 hypothetical protein [Cronobacter sakazakii]EIX1535247.1 hypothetical protein [Cronobacter sakazakii]
MGSKDLKYQVVYRGDKLETIIPGQWVFFQRLKEYGGGYWFGKTYDDCFWFEIERPVSLAEGLDYLILITKVQATSHEFDANYSLFD